MKDLRKHIEENRESYEVYQTDEDSLWDGIADALEQKPRRSWTVLKIAASVVLLFIVGFSAIQFANSSKKFEDGISLSDISPELAEAEFYYSRLVDEKFAMIKAVTKNMDPLIISEMQMLDSAYLDLKNDLKDNMDNEEVISAMIQNYRIKLQILEQILENIDSTNEEENKNEEGINI